MATSNALSKKSASAKDRTLAKDRTSSPDGALSFASALVLSLALAFFLLGCADSGLFQIEIVKVTETSPELFSIASASTPTPFVLLEPTHTPEPTSTPTPVISDTPTPLPTPSPAPVEGSLVVAALPTEAVADALPKPMPEIVTGPAINYVVIISIDGLRPDALDIATTPMLDELRARGAYCPQAQTISLSITLPSHASMLSGMTADKHGIQWGLPYIGWPGMEGPTLFNVAHDAGLSTAMIFGKEKMNYLVLPNSVDYLFGVDAHDPEIKDQALELIEAGLPNLLFIHFPDTDRVGHAYGWMSDNQFYAITFVDGLIGEIVAALENGGYLANTLLIITADHGGHGFDHGDDSPLDRTIPWLAVGPGVPQDVILYGHINTYDTAATAAYALNLPIPDKWDGKPVVDIFQLDLMTSR